MIKKIIYLIIIMLCLSSCDQISGVQVFLATNDLQQGTNRFSIAVADKNGFINSDVLSVKFEGEGGYPKFEQDLKFIEFKDYYDSGLKRGVFSEIVEFNKKGAWTLILGDANIEFTVKEYSDSVTVGDIAPKSDNLTINETSLLKLSSGSSPDERFYNHKINDLLKDKIPFIVSFLSPAFCTSPTCGPQMETLSEFVDIYGSKVPVIHVETYQNPQSVKSDFTSAIINPIILEWGINSEQWLYIISGKGMVVAKFEGYASLDQITEYIESISLIN